MENLCAYGDSEASQDYGVLYLIQECTMVIALALLGGILVGIGGSAAMVYWLAIHPM